MSTSERSSVSNFQPTFDEVVAYNKKTIIYVGGLDEQVNDEALAAAFRPFGEILQISIPKDVATHKHRGFGFVEFEETEDAQHALDNMNDSEFFGRVIKCNIAKPNAIKAQAVWSEGAFTDTQQVTAAIQHQQNQLEKEQEARQAQQQSS